MHSADKRGYIQAELKAIEAQNDVACDREQLRRRQDDVQNAIDTVADPVLKTAYQRKLSVLRGKP